MNTLNSYKKNSEHSRQHYYRSATNSRNQPKIEPFLIVRTENYVRPNQLSRFAHNKGGSVIFAHMHMCKFQAHFRGVLCGAFRVQRDAFACENHIGLCCLRVLIFLIRNRKIALVLVTVPFDVNSLKNRGSLVLKSLLRCVRLSVLVWEFRVIMNIFLKINL